jgi:nucleoid DNA-binding protein
MRIWTLKGRDQFNPATLPVMETISRSKKPWPRQILPKHVADLVDQWLRKEFGYELPWVLVQLSVRLTMAAIRFFVDRDHLVHFRGYGNFQKEWVKERSARNPRNGERIRVPPHVRPRFKPDMDWQDDLTYTHYGYPRSHGTLARARTRYYLKKMIEQGLVTKLADKSLAKLGMTRDQFNAVLLEHGIAPTPDSAQRNAHA